MSTPAFSPTLAKSVRDVGVVAVLMIEDAKDAIPLARALVAGGITTMELTLRTPAALDSLRAVAAEVPEMTAGAGTVLTAKQVKEVADAGAAFAVSPGCNPATLEASREIGLSFAPGIMTPSDIELALAHDCKLLKFFPAESSGGLPHLKNIAAPYAHLGLEYLPLGGLNADNMGTYLSFPAVAAIGGSWVAKKEVVAAGDWDGITATARDAVKRAAR